MTKADELAHQGRAWIEEVEAVISDLPEGDEKAEASHHAARIHHHMTKLAKMAHAKGQLVAFSPIDKQP